jgi:hypothetical protein
MSFSTRRIEWLRERAVKTVWVFIELSQETSHWAQIQNPNNVRSSQTKSDGSGLCMPDALDWRKAVQVGICLN